MLERCENSGDKSGTHVIFNRFCIHADEIVNENVQILRALGECNLTNLSDNDILSFRETA